MKKDFLKNPRVINLICTAVLGLLPFIYVLVKLIIDPTPVSLITSEWNDELFYFKQVEAIIDHGYPLGYYGFNDGHALSLSFAAWSPVLVWPWVVLGFIFGWTMKSVFVYNAIIYSVALILFGVMTKPSVKQTIAISVWFFAFFLNLRYIYSCMPEVICFAHLLVFWGCMLAYFRTSKKRYIVTAIVLGSLMTWMRPYMILFLVFALLVMFFKASGKKNKIIAFSISFAVVGFTAFIYYLLNHFLSAEYFMPFFYTDFITTFFTSGFGAGVHNLFGTLYYKGMDFYRFMKDAFYIDSAPGMFFDIYLFMMAVQAVQLIAEKKISEKAAEKSAEKSDENVSEESSGKASKRSSLKKLIPALDGDFYCRLYMLFADFALLIAILLMYKLIEGSKHLLTFIAVGVILMIVKKEKSWICALLMSLCLIYFGVFHAIGNDYDFGIPKTTAESESRYEYFRSTFEREIVLDETNVPSYDNAVIWEFRDVVDGEDVTTDWQMLYAVPSGMGINCCFDYSADNFDTLKTRYISAPSGGRIEQLCIENGYGLIAKDERFCVYARY
ncbi:MAG: hypothetical protein J5696_10505 [Lachnospiraceae bacterium]|nr:hypothetical protein [Lachnospiraceae bacterium]